MDHGGVVAEKGEGVEGHITVEDTPKHVSLISMILPDMFLQLTARHEDFIAAFTGESQTKQTPPPGLDVFAAQDCDLNMLKQK